MAERIPGTVTPRIEGGVLIFGEGDVFDFNIKLHLSALGEEIDDLTDYTFQASFRDAGGKLIHVFTGEGDEDLVFTLAFTSDVSAKFPAGRYSYDICISSPDGTRCTAAESVPAIVR
ncbi:MAG: hypothetical protein IJQ80_04340 [Clostridia bacterium]|nr:hypothetical protein [Clostridia bacterium]